MIGIDAGLPKDCSSCQMSMYFNYNGETCAYCVLIRKALNIETFMYGRDKDCLLIELDKED